MLDTDQPKVALDDARTRQAALLQLIYFTDQQAMSLLRLYVTIAVAAATGAAAGFAPGTWIPVSASLGLMAAATSLVIGCVFCFRAMQTAELTFPGRGADFWRAAIASSSNEFAYVAERYLEDLSAGQSKDRATNKVAARALNRAKWAGIVAPISALIAAALVTPALRHLY